MLRRRAAACATGLVALFVQIPAAAQGLSVPDAGLDPIPLDAECPPLPRPHQPYPFAPGERLDYDVDVLTARAATLTFTVLAPTGHGASAEQPVRARALTNTLFSKVRKVKSQGISYLQTRDLHPRSLREDAVEDDVVKNAEVKFPDDGNREVVINWRRGDSVGEHRQHFANDALDLIGAIYYFRAIPLSDGQRVCFDVYALRHMWRLWGTVSGKEHVSTPSGEFETFHLAGEAARLDKPESRRKLHVWISDDHRHLPVAAMGEIDLGPVRATLAEVSRTDARRERQPTKERALDW